MSAYKIVRTDYVAYRNLREIKVIWLPCRRVDACRPGRSVCRAQHIGTDHEILLCIEKPSRSHKLRPPVLCVRIGRERVAYPYHLPLVPLLPQPVGAVIDHAEPFDASTRLEFKCPFVYVFVSCHVSVKLLSYLKKPAKILNISVNRGAKMIQCLNICNLSEKFGKLF